MRSVFDFLFGDSDLPWGLQVFWKFLVLGLAGVIFYVASTTPGLAGWQIGVLCVLAGVFIVVGLFTKLGDG